MGFLPPADTLAGLGCMRLSTAQERDPDRGVEVLHAALVAANTLGVTLLLDTADAYCRDEQERGT